MALTPAAVERLQREGRSLSDRDRKMADLLEAVIDAKLPLLYRRGKVVRPRFSQFASRAVVLELQSRYSAKGWFVDIEPPQRSSPGYRLSLTARSRIACKT